MTHEEWLTERRTGIGGSDVPSVLGISRWTTPYELWEEKTGRSAGVEENDVMSLGKYLEPYIAKKYTEKTGRKVQERHMSFVHPEYPFMRANLDREILKDKRGVGILEIKALGSFPFRKLKMSGIDNMYICQLQHYLFVTGRSWGAFAVMNRDNGELIHFDVEPDKTFQDLILEKCIEFWKYVEADTPPPRDDATENIPDDNGEIVNVSGNEWEKTINHYKEMSNLASQASELKTEAEDKLKELIGDKPAVEGYGLRVYYKASKPRTSLDKKKLITEHPEIDFTQYEKLSKITRAFKPYILDKQQITF